jgi:hypothetical protein
MTITLSSSLYHTINETYVYDSSDAFPAVDSPNALALPFLLGIEAWYKSDYSAIHDNHTEL